MQYRVSYIVYVYNAEKTLERCVESLIYGREKNIEIVLAEDRSQDESRKMCSKLSERFGNITYIYNERHRGKAYTRNQALQRAGGRYIIFVESKDWVSREYGEWLCNVTESGRQTLAVSGFRTTTGTFGYEQDCLFNGGCQQYIELESYFALARQGLLQKLWNKAFCLEVIQSYNLQFDEKQESLSEFHFIVDYIKAAQCRKFLVLNCPLYIYVIDGNREVDAKESLGLFMGESEEYCRLADFFIKEPETRAKKCNYELDMLKMKYICKIICDRETNCKVKRECLQQIVNDRRCVGYFIRGAKDVFFDQLKQKKENISREREKKRKENQEILNDRLIQKNCSRLKINKFSIISQNCIGGVLYHDMGVQFQSPTINLFFEAADFMKFVMNLRYYMKCRMIVYWGLDYPIGELDDIKIHFMHYSTCEEALDCWNRRKKRLDYNKIIVVATDRDGFSEKEFQEWRSLSYKKVLFTVNRKYKNEEGVIYYPEYRKYKCVPDLIFDRKFYKGGVLLSMVNQI